LAIVIVVATFRTLPDFAIFNPRRAQISAEVKAFAQSPASDKWADVATQSMGRGRFTIFSEIVLFANGAINVEIYDRLFLISIVALLLFQVCNRGGIMRGDTGLWFAILAVTIVNAVFVIIMQWNSTQNGLNLHPGFFFTHDPFWLVAVRRLLPVVSSNIGFGWVYVRYGIESSMLANFATLIAASLLFRFVFINLF
jgi:hypothetical protein